MGTTIAIIVLLVLVGLVLITFEFLTPTFGPLAALGLACLGLAVWQGFTLSAVTGTILLIAILIAVPVYVVFLVRSLPKLPGAKKLFLEKVPRLTASGTPDAAAMEDLVGKTGTAETMLRPSGAVRIEGRRVVAVAESGVIEEGAAVKVIATSGMNLVVRAVPAEEAAKEVRA